MSAHKPQPAVEAKPRSFGWMAEYADEHSLLAASRKVRDSGYTKTDAYTPFPVHGIDEALGIKPTILPFIVLSMALIGLTGAISMQVWMNAIDYPYIISGKPMWSIPAFIPVTFETTILFSAFTTFFAMWGLNLLPRFSNPLFANPRFDRVTDDRFFLHVDSRDKYFNRESVKELLAGTSPHSLEEVVEDSTPNKFPTMIWMGLATLFLGSLVPASIVANMRASNDDRPRWHVFFDMDFQPKKKAQSTTTIFADGRTSRPQVPGTVARGQLDEQDTFYLGYDPTKIASIVTSSRARLVSVADEPKAPSLDVPIEDAAKKPAEPPKAEEKPAEVKKESTEPAKVEEKKTDAVKKSDDSAKPAEPKKDEAKKKKAKPVEKSPEKTDAKKEEPKKEDAKPEVTKPKPADSPAPSAATTPAAAAPVAAAPVAAAPAVPAGPNLPWATDFPVELSSDMLALGKKKFEIYCSVCHGYGGDGDGLVHRRADQLQQGYWLPPTSMHEQRIRDQAVGNIFYTISQGKGKMASYAAVLTPKERWAIVMYVRALQRSRNADIKDVPVDERANIKELKKAE